jgi:N-formylglutamate deformylase
MADPFRFIAGSTPLVVSLPHDSTHIPEAIARRMTPAALATPDTDWHVAKLYDFAEGLGATVLTATHSRYVVDLNRDPAGEALYPGADNTELCPLRTFDQEPIYRAGQEPNDAEIAQRIDRFWQPYHARLCEAIAETRDRHGVAVVFDGHTIRSRVARFFTGQLPDLNLGTARGASVAPDLGARVFAILEGSGYGAVRDQRFTGGYITRSYGRPAEGAHVLQLELTWRTYMEEGPPYAYLPDRAGRLKAVLRAMLESGMDWALARR